MFKAARYKKYVVFFLVLLIGMISNLSSFSGVVFAGTTTYYVNATSGLDTNDGTTALTAWKTINYAATRDYSSVLNSGNIVEICIASGTYPELVTPSSSGVEILPITANISISGGNTVTFPSGTNLSSVNVGDYIYIYRSWRSNNGYFQITAFNDTTDTVTVANTSFPRTENGTSGDFDYLSASIGRPIIYRYCGLDTNYPEINLAGTNCQGINIENKKYLIFEKIKISNADTSVCGGQGGTSIPIKDSSNIIISNMEVFNSDGPAITMRSLEGSTIGSSYNMVIDSIFYDNGQSFGSGEAVYIGYDNSRCVDGVTQNSNYNHIIRNEIYATLTLGENAIDVKPGCSETNNNIGTLIEGNDIHDFISSKGNGIIFINRYSNKTLIYNNSIRNIKTDSTCNGCYTSAIDIRDSLDDVFIFNNIIYDYTKHTSTDKIYAFRIDGTDKDTVSGSGVHVYNNTINNIPRGMLLEYYPAVGDTIDANIRNNLFSSITDNVSITSWGTGNSFTLSNNLYPSTPNVYGTESGRVVDISPRFVNESGDNFNLLNTSPAKDAGFDLSSLLPPFDISYSTRPFAGNFDIGAYENQQAIFTSNSTYYVNASTGSNSNDGTTPSTPWATIKYATEQNYASLLSGGDTVRICIDPGTYPNELYFNSNTPPPAPLVNATTNGLELVPITSDVEILDNRRLQFPSGTNLSSVNIGDYLYVYRSKQSNNGYYEIRGVNDTTDTLTLDENVFSVPEVGVSGDLNQLSASVGRPIIYENCNPIGGDVVLNLDGVTCEGIDLEFTNYLIFKDLVVKGTDNSTCGGSGGTAIPMLDSDFNVFDGIEVTDNDAQGFQLLGSNTTSLGSSYNIIINSKIYGNGTGSTAREGVFIGQSSCASGASQRNNYNHIIDNEFYDISQATLSQNSVEIRSACSETNANVGNVIESNYFHDVITTSNNGVIYVDQKAFDTLIFNNLFEDTTTNTACSGCYTSVINLRRNQEGVFVFNNIIWKSVLTNPTDRVYAMRVDSTDVDSVSGTGVHIYNNTIHNLNRGLHFEYYAAEVGATIDTKVRNNIISSVTSDVILEWSSSGGVGQGQHTLSHNMYTTAPSQYASETGRVVNASPGFTDAVNGDFKLISLSPARNTGTDLTAYFNIDFDYNERPFDASFDIGALEFVLKVPEYLNNLNQVLVSDSTPVAVNGWVNETRILITGSTFDPNLHDSIELCVEIQPLATAFTNIETICSDIVENQGVELEMSVVVGGLVTGQSYHWQAFVRDQDPNSTAWVSFGGNLETEKDFSVDIDAPSALSAVVYDGNVIGSDSEMNVGGSLNQLTANWDGFSDVGSGIERYEYSVGTTPGANNISDWVDAGNVTEILSDALFLRTGVLYYFNIRAYDYGNNASAIVSSNGQYVMPSLVFSVSTNEVVFNNLNPITNNQETQDMTITTSTNAYGGYVVRAYQSSPLQYSDTIIPPFSDGTYDSPAAWGSTQCSGNSCGIGYTTSDNLVQGIDRFEGGTKFAPFSQSAPGDIIADRLNGVDGKPIIEDEVTITTKVAVPANQPAGVYTSSILYTVVPQY